jgi:hypothetical protein
MSYADLQLLNYDVAKGFVMAMMKKQGGPEGVSVQIPCVKKNRNCQ